MGYFQVRYDSRVVNNNHRGFIRLATLAALKRKSRLLAFKSPLSYGDASTKNATWKLWVKRITRLRPNVILKRSCSLAMSRWSLRLIYTSVFKLKVASYLWDKLFFKNVYYSFCYFWITNNVQLINNLSISEVILHEPLFVTELRIHITKCCGQANTFGVQSSVTR